MEDLGVDGRIISKSIFKKEDRWGDWIDLVQDRHKWCDLVNTVTNIGGPQNAENFLTSLGTVGLSRKVLLYRIS